MKNDSRSTRRFARTASRRRLAPVAAAVLLAIAAVLMGCGGSAATTAPAGAPTTTVHPGGEVVLMTHDSFAVSKGVLEDFTARTGIKVRVLKSGDAGAMLNQAILAKDHPLADVLYGVDNTFLSRALDAGIFEPYESPGLASVPLEFQLDPSHRATPIDYGDICVNYDKAAFTGAVKAPATLRDLTKPEYRGKLVVENPATSSPGLAFVLATIAEFGETGAYTWRDYWADLVKNDVLVVGGWEDAYNSAFSGGSGKGDRPLVVSYATSPVAEVVFAETPITVAPTGIVAAGAFRQVEFAGVLAKAKNPEGARRFVDFLLSSKFQEDMPLQMFVYPVSTTATLPPEFATYAGVPTRPAAIDPALIGANRDRWIEEWTSIVLP
jgi:thiamine transport system substrate-binding protein